MTIGKKGFEFYMFIVILRFDTYGHAGGGFDPGAGGADDGDGDCHAGDGGDGGSEIEGASY